MIGSRSTPASVRDVQRYWQAHPLLTHELAAPGSPEYFDTFDRIKREDAEPYSGAYWEFDRYAGQQVLDVGCGPGWYTVQYARGGAEVTAVDLTQAATALAKAHLDHRGLSARIVQASAERLPFAAGSFDLVASSGVLHHTPDCLGAIAECRRVVRRGGRAKITLYHKGVLHHEAVFPMLRLGLRLLSVRHPGADLHDSGDVDEFVRRYDGAGNPVGIAKTTAGWLEDFRRVGFAVVGSELHYFPRRLLPFSRWVPNRAHRLLDRYLGTMIYFDLLPV